MLMTKAWKVKQEQERAQEKLDAIIKQQESQQAYEREKAAQNASEALAWQLKTDNTPKTSLWGFPPHFLSISGQCWLF